VLERTIPVFEALIKADPEERCEYYGQLGYALKDKRNPEYAKAEEALTHAIKIRGPAKDNGHRLYEYNRAICRIRQDPDFAQGKASTPERRDLIWADINVAKERIVHPIDDRDADFKRWQDLNPA
jgi:hypothetical protein